MPHYADYHRTVIGYHGTKKSTALKIIQGECGFEPSENDDDWLGHGIYFWEYAPQQAFLWAKQRKKKSRWPEEEEVAVLASMIRLGFCFDLLDPENVKTLGGYYQARQQTLNESPDLKPVSNVMSQKRLNCAVFNFAYETLESDGKPLDTCRAVFVPTTKTDRIWPGSGINAHAHIQICVRNPECILGTWLVKPTEEPKDEEESPREEEAEEQRLDAQTILESDPEGPA